MVSGHLALLLARLHMSGRSVPYYHHPTVSMSCMYLMPAIRCVWPITYVFNALPALRARQGHDGSDVRRLGNARACPGAESHWACGGSGAFPHQEVGLEPQDMWQYRSPVGRWSWCLGHMAMLEPSCVGVGLEP
jgi:hypothetical protein